MYLLVLQNNYRKSQIFRFVLFENVFTRPHISKLSRFGCKVVVENTLAEV